ncbi:MAG: hypothetical protein IT374_16570 [Polyangiaceae bacterium]|nr:hypothetical protein [Polyangiaceae bacterium]
MQPTTAALAALLALAPQSLALAGDAPVAAGDGPSPAEKRARYSLPYLLRPAVAPNLARLDLAYAPRDGAATMAPVLTAGYKPIASLQDLGFYGRVGWVKDTPDAGASGSAVTNPLLFALFTPELSRGLRLPLFVGATAPVGAGGGDSPQKATRAALGAGIAARQGMDNALYVTNYQTTTAGVGVAWIKDGLTAQADATVLQLTRVKGAAVDKDASRTNSTFAVHVGYQVIPLVTVSVEAHHQRWLSTPAAVKASPAARDNTTVGGGIRLNLAVSKGALLRPGLAYFVPVDDPLKKAGERFVQFDLPFAF